MKNSMFQKIQIQKESLFSLEEMKQLDALAVENYNLPIELMMENAGLGLARIVASSVGKESLICFGIGPGNNGGGALVAARRLAGWGYSCHLLQASKSLGLLATKQLKRAMAFGTELALKIPFGTEVFVDGFFGFSQRFPLPSNVIKILDQANQETFLKISLDLPTGISKGLESTFFNADIVCTLAAPKKLLFQKKYSPRVFLIDLGIPEQAYRNFRKDLCLPFQNDIIVEIDLARDLLLE